MVIFEWWIGVDISLFLVLFKAAYVILKHIVFGEQILRFKSHLCLVLAM